MGEITSHFPALSYVGLQELRPMYGQAEFGQSVEAGPEALVEKSDTPQSAKGLLSLSAL